MMSQNTNNNAILKETSLESHNNQYESEVSALKDTISTLEKEKEYLMERCRMANLEKNK